MICSECSLEAKIPRGRKMCSRCQWQKYPRKITDERRQKVRAFLKERVAENVRRYLGFLLEHPCVDCGESNLVLLECDHVDGEKKYNVGVAVYSSSPWETVERELAKCVVRCVRCHRLKTARERNWQRMLVERARQLGNPNPLSVLEELAVVKSADTSS